MTLNEINDSLVSDCSLVETKWKTSPVLNYYYQLNSYLQPFQAIFRDESIAPPTIQAVMQDFINKSRSFTDQVDVGAFYIAVTELKKSISDGSFGSTRFKRIEADLLGTLDQIWASFNSLIRTPADYGKILRCMDLISSIDVMLTTIVTEQRVLGSFLLEVERPLEHLETEAELAFQIFDEEMSLREFSKKLESFDLLYVTCLDILRISEVEFPLRVRQIEFGSLFTKIVGSKQAIGLLKEVLTKTFELIFKKFTMEGQIERIGAQLDVLDKQIGLLSEIKTQIGEEAFQSFWKDNEENIKKATVNLSRGMVKLSTKVTSVKVDKKAVSIERENQQKYLEEFKRKQLENKVEEVTKTE